VDVVAETGDRDSITRLLDMFDGITAKGTELMVVLTTNHKERIHQGMVRPGRLDAMVHIGALDVNGIRRMIHALVPLEFLGNLDYDEIGEAMGVGTDKGFLPAFVKEAIDRAMRYAIARNEGVPQQLETEDFVQAAVGLESQHELMLAADEGKKPEPLAKALRREVASVVGEAKIVDMDGDPVFAIESEQPDGVAAAK
jgi:SpoVK/Ycf46/Vps4 family AAA+-type ATPase